MRFPVAAVQVVLLGTPAVSGARQEREAEAPTRCRRESPYEVVSCYAAELGRSLLALGHPEEAFAVLSDARGRTSSPAIEELLRIAAAAAGTCEVVGELGGTAVAEAQRELDGCSRLPGLRGRRACARAASLATGGRVAQEWNRALAPFLEGSRVR